MSRQPGTILPIQGITVRRLEGIKRMLQARIEEATEELQVTEAALGAAKLRETKMREENERRSR